jgi:hypothetical protein
LKNFFQLSIITSAIITLIGCQSQDERLEKAMHKSITWMWAQQSDDGGWHSQTHAVLKDGKALTPYILYYLLLIPEDKFKRPEGAVEKSVEFIRREIRSSMMMSPDSVINLNYPNYIAAYALRVLCLLKKDTSLQYIIADHLLNEQFVEHRGINPDNVAYGGWGYGEPDLPFGEHGHVDISHTRRTVEALLEWNQIKCPVAELSQKVENKQVEVLGDLGAKETHTQDSFLHGRVQHDPTKMNVSQAAALFLQGVQRSSADLRLYEGCTSRKDLPFDGGFVSSVATLATNKCEPVFIKEAGYHYPSYATATCDGLIALHTLGMTDSEAYKDAVLWLAKNQNMNTIDGLSSHDPEQWYQVMHYYHFAVRAEAMTVAGIEGPWSEQLKRMLIKEQQPDGFYMNPLGGVNKEDDPLMATIFAIQAQRILVHP